MRRVAGPRRDARRAAAECDVEPVRRRERRGRERLDRGRRGASAKRPNAASVNRAHAASASSRDRRSSAPAPRGQNRSPTPRLMAKPIETSARRTSPTSQPPAEQVEDDEHGHREAGLAGGERDRVRRVGGEHRRERQHDPEAGLVAAEGGDERRPRRCRSASRRGPARSRLRVERARAQHGERAEHDPEGVLDRRPRRPRAPRSPGPAAPRTLLRNQTEPAPACAAASRPDAASAMPWRRTNRSQRDPSPPVAAPPASAALATTSSVT